VEAYKKYETKAESRHGLARPAGINKVSKSKKRANKLRALAGAFTDGQQQDEPQQLDSLESKYIIRERIGEGKHGVTVYRCALRETGQQFAVKRVPKELFGSSHGDDRAIVEALQGRKHLVQTCEVIEGANTVDTVMELAAGGDLFEMIDAHGPLSEDRARGVFAGVLAGLEQVHAAGFVHRDLKLENILLTTDEPTAPEHVRLADFEFCTLAPAMGAVGSIAYAAPETLDGAPYTAAVDMWASGVALYAMLSASAPFDTPDDGNDTVRRIRAAVPGMPLVEPCWADVSPAAKDLVHRLLHPDPQQRLDLGAAINHPWLAGASQLPQPEAQPSKPKFKLSCTWSTKTKRWSQHMPSNATAAGPAEGQTSMLLDEDEQCPLVTCPAEWAPQPVVRNRANSL